MPDLLDPHTALLCLVVLFASLGPGALATFLQTRGQSKVPATQAQVRTI